jgi:hypothetical protein
MDGTRGSTASERSPRNFKGQENQIGNTLAGRLNDQASIRNRLESDITKSQSIGVAAKVVVTVSIFTYL